MTNGDAAAHGIRSAGIAGDVIAWRDVLHEGPVPADAGPAELRAIRASFIAGRTRGDPAAIEREFAERDRALDAIGPSEDVVLWFEPDLYDQLQLLEVLDRLSAHQRRSPRGGWRSLQIVPQDCYLGPSSSAELLDRFDQRAPVTASQLELGAWGWQLFRAGDPQALLILSRSPQTSLPYLPAALHRLLEELPSVRNGLSRCEQQAVEALKNRPIRMGDAFRAAHHDREQFIFLGDTIFAWQLERLAGGPHPLVAAESNAPIRVPPDDSAREFWSQRVRLTDAGRDVLEGKADAVALNGIDRWIGGLHLTGRPFLWRWDEAMEAPVQRPG
ncbi:MAG TPA: DUF1835 domain-containing protein [Gemmatimonadaceae bacterium]|nr:DUF1835 domain-containing protein [Gemmatimonadaceae bacterium]